MACKPLAAGCGRVSRVLDGRSVGVAGGRRRGTSRLDLDYNDVLPHKGVGVILCSLVKLGASW